MMSPYVSATNLTYLEHAFQTIILANHVVLCLDVIHYVILHFLLEEGVHFHLGAQGTI